MFYNCTSLTVAPNLPSSKMGKSSYDGMFRGCTSLTTAPALPATALEEECYEDMFAGCSNLTTVPALEATSLAEGCYYEMFACCEQLKVYSTNEHEGYKKAWKIPTGAQASVEALGPYTWWNVYMFYDTGGDFTGDPVIGTTYYVAGQSISPSNPGSSSDSDSGSSSSHSSGSSSSSSHSSGSSSYQAITPVKTYNAAENTGKGGGTKASYNGAYTANAEGSAGNLGNHNKATEPYNADNAKTTSGWDLIKNDIAARSVVDATKKTNSLGDNYTVVMNGATRVDNEVIRSLQSSFVSNLTLAMENGASFVVPTAILKTNPAGILANGSQPDFYLDITCNTTRDVQKGILDTQFVPLSTIKANQGDESSRMIAVRTNNADMSKLATITLQQTDPSKTKARICICDATRGKALPYRTVTFTKGMASFPLLVGNWNLFVVEE